MSSDPMIDAMQAENALLRQRIAELETSERALRAIVQTTFDHLDPVIYIRDPEGTFTLVNEAHSQVLKRQRDDVLGKKDSDLFPREKRAEAALRESQSLLQAILDHSSMVVYAKDKEGRYILISSEGARQLGKTQREIIGKMDHDFLPGPMADAIRADERRITETGAMEENEDVIPLDDGPHTYLSTRFPLRDDAGEIYAVCGVATDITKLKRAEEERNQMREEIIQVQELAIRELSTPLFPIAEGVVAMPLLGMIDETCVKQIIDTLLAGVAQKQASIVILDVTGVQHVDSRVTSFLAQATKAVRLLGAEVVLTGVQPQMARMLVELDMKLDQMITLGTLQSGIELALARRGNAGRLRQRPDR